MAEHESKKIDLDALSQAVLEIKKADITEVKSFSKPPAGVIAAIGAVTILIENGNTKGEAGVSYYTVNFQHVCYYTKIVIILNTDIFIYMTCF